MARNIPYLLLALSSLFSCEEVDHCPYADFIDVESTCYDSNLGLAFMASNYYGELPVLQWEFHILKDTTDGWTPDDLKISESGNAIYIIPDSILLNNPQIVARVKTSCGNTFLYSKYFRFFRTTSGGCVTWEEHEF